MKIGKELALEAKKKGICRSWFEEMKDLTDKKKLVAIYLRGIDFCLANDYPDNDYIRHNFRGVMEPMGVHLDEHVSLSDPRKAVLLGDCKGSISIKGYAVSEIFLKHASEVTIKAEGHSFVMIDMFDNTKLLVIASDDAKICVNRYGGSVKIETLGNAKIKVIEKHKKTY
jgi:hypothetical protein